MTDSGGANIAFDAARVTLDRLYKENAKFRKALEKIAAAGSAEGPEVDDWGGSTEAAEKYGFEQGQFEAAEIARAALKEKDTP